MQLFPFAVLNGDMGRQVVHLLDSPEGLAQAAWIQHIPAAMLHVQSVECTAALSDQHHHLVPPREQFPDKVCSQVTRSTGNSDSFHAG